MAGKLGIFFHSWHILVSDDIASSPTEAEMPISFIFIFIFAQMRKQGHHANTTTGTISAFALRKAELTVQIEPLTGGT
jgi:hypothetical protein